MPCYHPLKGYFSERENENGKRPLVFCSDKALVPVVQMVPCGVCIGCRLDRSRQWAIRCMHEASLFDDNCFITLTFNNEHLARNKSLVGSDFQNFMKRLRKFISPRQVRFFHCGEYGAKHARPHHHAILFGYDFPDKVLHRNPSSSKEFPVYVSAILNKLWTFGFSTIQSVTEDSCSYVARYVLKKFNESGLYGLDKEMAQAQFYGDRKPEYITMSRNPGIGSKWYDKYRDEIYRDGCVIYKGFSIKAPKYYDSKYEIDFPFKLAMIKAERERLAFEKDNSPTKLAVKEEIVLSSLKQYKRRYEDGA